MFVINIFMEFVSLTGNVALALFALMNYFPLHNKPTLARVNGVARSRSGKVGNLGETR